MAVVQLAVHTNPLLWTSSGAHSSPRAKRPRGSHLYETKRNLGNFEPKYTSEKRRASCSRRAAPTQDCSTISRILTFDYFRITVVATAKHGDVHGIDETCFRGFFLCVQDRGFFVCAAPCGCTYFGPCHGRLGFSGPVLTRAGLCSSRRRPRKPVPGCPHWPAAGSCTPQARGNHRDFFLKNYETRGTMMIC